MKKIGLLLIASAISIFTLTIVAPSSNVNAAWSSPSQCGAIAGGSTHDYAGAIVRLWKQTRTINSNGSITYSPAQEIHSYQSGINVSMKTHGDSASDGNIVRLNNSSSGGVDIRRSTQSFSTESAGNCAGQIVLKGQGNGEWGLDCDYSKHNSYFQKIQAVISGTPNGMAAGGEWRDIRDDIQSPANGGTAIYEFKYIETVRVNGGNTSRASWTIDGSQTTTNSVMVDRTNGGVTFTHSAVRNKYYPNVPSVPLPPNYPVPPQPYTGWSQVNCNTHTYTDSSGSHTYGTVNRDRCNQWNAYYEAIRRAEVYATAASVSNVHFGIGQVVYDKNGTPKSAIPNGSGGYTPFIAPSFSNNLNDVNSIDNSVDFNSNQESFSISSNKFAGVVSSNRLSAGDKYCEWLEYEVTGYDTDNGYSYDLDNTNNPIAQRSNMACIYIKSNWDPIATQRIDRIEGHSGSNSRGTTDGLQQGSGNISYDGWVDENYRFIGWMNNQGPDFSDDTLDVFTSFNTFGSGSNNNNQTRVGAYYNAGELMTPFLSNSTGRIRADQVTQTSCQQMIWASIYADRGEHNGNTGNACVYVPYFYHIKNPTLNRQGSTGPVQQGDSIQLQATARLPQTSDGSGPGVDNNGRHHTVSENVGWAIERSDDGGAWNAVAGHSGSRVWQPNNNVETINDPNLAVISGNDTHNMPIGKKVCFRLRIDKGSQDTGVIYSDPNCFTITKSPKIQVGNRDVLTGYGIPAGADDSCTTEPNSSVVTTGAPSYVSSYPNKNLYGSWGEYGVFATGNITNFGSAAYDSSDAGAGKLRFSNQDSNGGYKSYGNPCTFNWFEKVGKKATDPSGDTFQVNDPVNAGKQVSHEGKIDVTAPGAAATTVEDTSFKNIKVSVFARDISSGIFGDPDIRVECPKLKITLSNSSTVNTGQWCTNGKAIGNFGESKDFDFVLNSSSYNPGKVTVQFINDASGPNGDRNIAIDTVTIKRVKDNTTAVIKAKDADKSQRLSNGGQSCSNDSIVVSSDGFLIFHQDITQYGHCYGIDIKESDYLAPTTSSTPAGKVSNIASPPLIAIPPLTNSSSLPANKKATVIYAKSDDCSNPGDGVIYIKNNIEYDTNGYNIEQIPRVILLADCGIIIDKDVTNVDASLITRGTINTCSARQASNIPLDVTSANYALTKDDCNKPLKISGHILAKKVNLLRTYGADLTSTTGDPTRPAEDFTQNPIDFISTYRQSYQEVKLIPENETNLPPRY